MYKTQWESITPEQESHHSIFRERKHAIGTTCVRYRSRSEGICGCNSRLRCSPAPLPRSRRQGRSADGQNDGVLSRSGGAEPQTAQRHSCHLHLLQLRSRCGQQQRPSQSLPFSRLSWRPNLVYCPLSRLRAGDERPSVAHHDDHARRGGLLLVLQGHNGQHGSTPPRLSFVQQSTHIVAFPDH